MFCKLSAFDPDALELPFLISVFMRLCTSSASDVFLSISSSRSCCCKSSSSSCCCRIRCISSRSCSSSKYRSRSRCSVSFLALRFWSFTSSIRRLLDDRELAILVSFLLPCVAECLVETSTFSSAFLLLPFLYQLRSRLGLYHQLMWITPTMFGFHNPCCARTISIVTHCFCFII